MVDKITSKPDHGEPLIEPGDKFFAPSTRYQLFFDDIERLIDELASEEVVSTGAVQQVYIQDGVFASGTTTIPSSTIPQNTEGDEYMTLSITPKDTANILVIEVLASADPSTLSTMTVALFQDSIADALACSVTEMAANLSQMFPIRYRMTAGTTSATTFKIRAGMNVAGTTRFNSLVMGGVINSHIMITEYSF